MDVWRYLPTLWVGRVAETRAERMEVERVTRVAVARVRTSSHKHRHRRWLRVPETTSRIETSGRSLASDPVERAR